jgi:hypothetical protein
MPSLTQCSPKQTIQNKEKETMANLSGFDARTVTIEKPNFEAIPAGKYPAVIIDSIEKENKQGTGSYLEITFQIIEGVFKGRNLWARLNLQNQSEKAMKIAHSELAELCLAVGNPTPHDSSELHNIPITIEVKCRKRPDTEEITNEIRGFSKHEQFCLQPQPKAQMPNSSMVNSSPWATKK